jgi:hypothetical protein
MEASLLLVSGRGLEAVMVLRLVEANDVGAVELWQARCRRIRRRPPAPEGGRASRRTEDFFYLLGILDVAWLRRNGKYQHF